MIEVSIRRRLGDFQLDAAFRAAGRGVTALFGRSGSGKTSVVTAVAGLNRPDEGRIAIDGVTFFDSTAGVNLPVQKRRVGCVFQDARLFPHMKVRDNLLYGWRRVPQDERRIALDTVVGLLGIGHLLDRRPHRLSGGETQRVALGRALLAQPRLLLMDEPLASLDAARKAEILPYLERLRDELDIPIVLVSHAMDEVVRLASTLVVMAEGRVAACGTVGEVLGRLDLAGVTGAQDAGAVLELTVLRHDAAERLTVLGFDGGELAVPAIAAPVGRALRLRVRARDVIVARTRPTDTSVVNAFGGVITAMAETVEGTVDLRIAVGSAALIARVTRQSCRRLELAVGVPVHALVKGVAFAPDAFPVGGTVVDI